ncbi:PREDICTED: LOW QUALITY PROTEIN: elicitor-responsive protein 1 [Tarenaya hassleriana]|uniref:LOW QUALITY PROTEIN: elicitor-responsive protein 1 n=1 Tax=Tarenaya hassleriana TaxID=28532 RepID=UPI00053C13BE|nr:PREDICTED: LOW QUALITY PROTEIN: elicitor-responsive protein 1 [Tarenaya hassleriana]
MAVGILEVNLISAKGLKCSDFLGKIDPYFVLVEYKGQIRKTSSAREGGRNPTWEEKVRWRAEYPGSGGDYALLVKLMDHDTFSSDDFLGQATVYVKEMLELGAEKGKAEIHPTKYRVVGADLNYSGEILLGVSFSLLDKDNDEEEDYGGWKSSQFD